MRFLGKLASENAYVALIRAGDQLFFSSQSLMDAAVEGVTLCLYKLNVCTCIVFNASSELHSQRYINLQSSEDFSYFSFFAIVKGTMCVWKISPCSFFPPVPLFFLILGLPPSCGQDQY